jgi:hypothetical protein
VLKGCRAFSPVDAKWKYGRSAVFLERRRP